MDALLLLQRQHEEVSRLFDRFEETESDDEKEEVFAELGDKLAVHAAIEERHFYPAVREVDAEEEIEEAYEEHTELKKLLLDCMEGTGSPGFDGIVAALRGAVEHHVKEEEGTLFPKVRKLLDKDERAEIGERMEEDAEAMEQEGDARKKVQPRPEEPALQP